ncbi:MAG: N-6 DNA methylase [Microscillaceae bacterium]|jgi:hypothetical protein|nr:N-6 DNA methylase [Microscillaceae bacterium]
MLSAAEIKQRCIEFAQNWMGESSEKAEAKTFWDEFFHCFGISRRRVASFEYAVTKLGAQKGYIDLFWESKLIVEHKSKGQDLDKAYHQAMDYFSGLKDYQLPKFVLVSDFARFRLYDLETNSQFELPLADLYLHIDLFGFISGREKTQIIPDVPANIEAAELLGDLHDALLESGIAGKTLELLLARLLFCMFADTTAIFNEPHQFKSVLAERVARTQGNGAHLGGDIAHIFNILNTPEKERQKYLPEELLVFPYINGGLFRDVLPPVGFGGNIKELFFKACAYNWHKISPAIFGSLFQAVLDPTKRRHLGAHYTSEKNILKAIKSLFLDDLYTEFEKVKTNKNQLRQLHEKISRFKFLDPACGCGNFLIITYREIRLLELEILKILYQDQTVLDISQLTLIRLQNFYGIEIEEASVMIARVAMWLVDHQMNMLLSETFGQYFRKLPLQDAAQIMEGNALQMDWGKLNGETFFDYIVGNPPFVGKQMRNSSQNADMEYVFKMVDNQNNYGVLDYVTAWYVKAAQYISSPPVRGGARGGCKVAFVSTNSIVQGEQVSALWRRLNKFNIKIFFAHRTFKWSNEAKGNAQVYCVIIGFYANGNGLFTNGAPPKQKKIFDYETPQAEPREIIATKNINAYLLDTVDILVENRERPIADVPEISRGSMANDGGNLIFFDEEELNQFLKKEPNAQTLIRPYMGSEDFINNLKRYCLWLESTSPVILSKLPEVLKRIEAVKKHRQNSQRETTQKLALTPYLFAEIRQPEVDYLVIPSVSSEKRFYIPIGFVSKEIIANTDVMYIPNATIYHFGILTSAMHMAWTRAVCGRMKSDYRYSNKLVYNNFPFPNQVSDKNLENVKQKAQIVLNTREKYFEQGNSLANLYDTKLMPKDLLKAHQDLDKAVDLCYRPQAFTHEINRVEFLFDLYNQYTAPLLNPKKKK